MKVFCENHVFLHAWRVDATVVALICLDLWRNGKMEVFGKNHVFLHVFLMKSRNAPTPP